LETQEKVTHLMGLQKESAVDRRKERKYLDCGVQEKKKTWTEHMVDDQEKVGRNLFENVEKDQEWEGTRPNNIGLGGLKGPRKANNEETLFKRQRSQEENPLSRDKAGIAPVLRKNKNGGNPAREHPTKVRVDQARGD